MSESSLGTDYKESRTSNHSAYYCHEELRLFSSVNNTKPYSVEYDVAWNCIHSISAIFQMIALSLILGGKCISF